MKFYLWTLSIYSVIATVLIVLLAMQNKELKTMPAGGPAPIALDYSKVYNLPVDASPVKGNADAPITIVAFSEFECPYCSKATELIDHVLGKYDGKVKIVFKNYPLSIHPAARPAAVAALAAGRQGKFWEMHDMLFAMQENLKNKDNLPEDGFKEYLNEEFINMAAGLNLDMDQFSADMKDQALMDQVNSEEALGNSVQVGGTPTFFVNGVRVPEPKQLEEVVAHFAEGKARR